MNILYFPCHSIHEYEEVKLFGELGYNVLSIGSYKIPSRPTDVEARPAILGMKEFPELQKYLPTKWGGPDLAHWYERIAPELVDWADIIMTMGLQDWFATNWQWISHKGCVFRSNGQSSPRVEAILGAMTPVLKIVRYSPIENRIPGYSGCDAMIRFYKDADVFKGWTGEVKEVINITQSMRQRSQACGWPVFENATRGLPRHLYGRGNVPDESWITGEISFEKMKEVMRQGRVFLYTGTYPAQYTMAFQEAWMTGMPMVVAGDELMGWQREVPSWIETGVNGFVGHSIADLNAYCQMLLEDDGLAKEISKNGRATACQLFDHDRIKNEWKEFLEGLMRK